MSSIILPGEEPILVDFRRSARSRRLSLRVAPVGRRITLTCPIGVTHSEAQDFVLRKEHWLRKHLSNARKEVQVRFGSVIPLEGRQHIVVEGAGRSVEIGTDQIHVPRSQPSGAAVARALKRLARDRLTSASDMYAMKLGLPYTRLCVRDTTSRWGSCSALSTLSYCWRLIMAPPEVLGYVAAHEVAHLAEMNHSPAFWKLVCDLYPGYDAPRRWLRREGSSLHIYRFAGE